MGNNQTIKNSKMQTPKIIWAKNSEFIYDNNENIIVKDENARKKYTNSINTHL